MPKTLWLPGGKGGGGKHALLSPSVELKEVSGQWMIVPTPKFISDCKEQGRSEVTRQVANGGFDAYVESCRRNMREGQRMAESPPEFLGGYGISRLVPTPKAFAEAFSAPETPVERVRWWTRLWNWLRGGTAW